MLEPVLGTGYGSRVQPWQKRRVEPNREAGPEPLRGAFDQACPQRVALHVTHNGQEVFILIDGEGFEAALPDVAAAAVTLAVAVHVSGQEPLHPGAQVAIAMRPEYSVEMIGHHAKAHEAHRYAGARLAKEAHEVMVVIVVMKDPGPAIAAIKGMVAIAAKISASGSRHGTIVAHGCGASKPKIAEEAVLESPVLQQHCLTLDTYGSRGQQQLGREFRVEKNPECPRFSP